MHAHGARPQVMHAMCTMTDYSLFSWAWSVVPYPAGVEHDFLEVPSQALENWVWDPAVLKRLSSHVDARTPLPDDLAAKLGASRRLGEGLRCEPFPASSRSRADVGRRARTLCDGAARTGTGGRFFCRCWTWSCTARPSRISARWKTCKRCTHAAIAKLWASTLCQVRCPPTARRVGAIRRPPAGAPAADPTAIARGSGGGRSGSPGTAPLASFYHICQGYDAGYYGYLWSEVYSCDVFSCFEAAPNRCFDELTGLRYRRRILEPGATRNGLAMLRGFLGREPSSDAFLRLVCGTAPVQPASTS